MSYCLVENISLVSLPSGPMPRPERQKMWSLQRRAHLDYVDDKTRREPLSDDEVTELQKLEERWRDQTPPHASKLTFPFAPKGKPGSVWRVHVDDAEILLAQHPTRLRVVQAGDPIPEIRPLEHSWRPTVADQTPCSTTAEASLAASVVRLGPEGVPELVSPGWSVGKVADAGPTER